MAIDTRIKKRPLQFSHSIYHETRAIYFLRFALEIYKISYFIFTRFIVFLRLHSMWKMFLDIFVQWSFARPELIIEKQLNQRRLNQKEQKNVRIFSFRNRMK